MAGAVRRRSRATISRAAESVKAAQPAQPMQVRTTKKRVPSSCWRRLRVPSASSVGWWPTASRR
uniref:hypothetical protein n=1 Tax=Streptomyces sp. HK1 TaxID=405041 RepID=UPI001F211678|nr:hypothetical protein [Streptomyces sp. HK1]